VHRDGPLTDVEVRSAVEGERDAVAAFYTRWSYTGVVSPADLIFIARAAGELIGVVRLASEEGVQVLRGMRVDGPWQRQGIGRRLLALVSEAIGSQGCYCIAYRHLDRFYGSIGFRPVEPSAAPRFLADRLAQYVRRDDQQYILLARAATDTFSIRRRVEAGDIDDLGHVSNIVYLRWVQDAASAHWAAIAPADAQAAIAWVVLRHEIDYRAPALRGDELEIRTRIGTASGMSFERLTSIHRAGEMRALAEARTLWCPIDLATGKPRRVTAALRNLFSQGDRLVGIRESRDKRR
jgi:acyl-CoA thioester hydrolase